MMNIATVQSVTIQIIYNLFLFICILRILNGFDKKLIFTMYKSATYIYAE